MKKTLTVNLNGRVFNIDEDAYQLLDNYLRNLRIHFRKEEGRDEILADFEARIEELLSSRMQPGYDVITIAEVESVIAQMGRPGDFGENEEDTSDDTSAGHRDEPFTETKKKFYRNPDDKMFAGLCSGLAAYAGWNVVIVRIIAAILIPVTYLWIVPVYLLLWLIIPEALSAEQKLEMQGKPITVENIGKVVADGIETAKRTALNNGCLAGFVDFIVAFFKVCLVGLGLLIGIPLTIALLLIIILLFGVLFGVSTGILGQLIPWSSSTFLFVNHPALATIAFCLILAIPLVALTYTLIAHFFRLKPLHPGVKWTGIILWIASIVALPFAGFKADWTAARKHNFGWTYLPDNNTLLHGDSITTERTDLLPPIHHIRMEKYLAANLLIEQTTADSTLLLIHGDSNLVDKVKTKLNLHSNSNNNNNNTLSLSISPHHHLRPTSPLLIHLKTPHPQSVKLYSVGNITIAGPLTGDRFSIYLEGAGKIQADSLYINTLKVENDGVGAIRLGGTTRRATLQLEGLGHINASELISDTVNASVNGVGSIQCHPLQYLVGNVVGIGSILYHSEPTAKNTHINGLGKIQRE
jgi:phage shock protein PspC (stress-responsive transcriptional regulator)